MLRKMGSSNKIPSNNTQIPNKLQVPIAKFQKNPRIGICHLEFPCDLILGNWNFSLNFLDVRNMSYYFIEKSSVLQTPPQLPRGKESNGRTQLLYLLREGGLPLYGRDVGRERRIQILDLVEARLVIS